MSPQFCCVSQLSPPSWLPLSLDFCDRTEASRGPSALGNNTSPSYLPTTQSFSSQSCRRPFPSSHNMSPLQNTWKKSCFWWLWLMPRHHRPALSSRSVPIPYFRLKIKTTHQHLKYRHTVPATTSNSTDLRHKQQTCFSLLHHALHQILPIALNGLKSREGGWTTSDSLLLSPNLSQRVAIRYRHLCPQSGPTTPEA